MLHFINIATHVKLHMYVFLAFLVIYLMMDLETHFGCDNTMTNAVYYAVTTHSTTGYGDITAQTAVAKWISVIHMIAVWILVSLTMFITIPT